MNCAEVIRSIPLYCYGEVSAETEERIEFHVAECVACAQELRRHRAFLESLETRADLNGAAMLASCRTSLRTALQSEAKPRIHWMDAIRNFTSLHIPMRIPVGAMALVALGFLAARYTPERFGGVRAGLGEPVFTSVRSVEPDASGRVQIAVDDVHRRMVSGALQDPHIQELLVSAVREESNPGVRVESIGVLKNSADSEDVRRVLLDALTHDPNAGVRLKALEGLKQYAGNSAVRKTVANVLLKDDDPGVRTQAIDLLTAHHDESIVGILQDAVQKEDNSYVRARCSRLLEQMKASVGTY